jgi:hypothetical protein
MTCCGIFNTGDVSVTLHMYSPLSEACNGLNSIEEVVMLICLGYIQRTVGVCTTKPSDTSYRQERLYGMPSIGLLCGSEIVALMTTPNGTVGAK